MVSPILEPIVNRPAHPLPITNLQQFPEELLEIIFCHLPPGSLKPSTLVCRRFAKIITTSRKIRYTFYSKAFRAMSTEVNAYLEQSKNEHEAYLRVIASREKAAKEFFDRPIEQHIKEDATIEEIQVETARMRRAKEIYERKEKRNCIYNWRWVILPATCCCCCGVGCCCLCLFNKIFYGTCVLVPPRLNQDDPNPLG